MGVIEVLAIWFALSLTGALAPGPLTAAVVMQASRKGRLHGILPMVGHAIVELAIVAAIILSVQAFVVDDLTKSLMIGIGGVLIIGFGMLALKDYRYDTSTQPTRNTPETDATGVIAATAQGAAVSILSPYFILWWFGIGLANVTMLMSELQVGVGTVFIAGVLVYLTHISTDFIYGAFLSLSTDKISRKAVVGGVNWVNIAIGLFQIALGAWFIVQVLFF